MTRDGVSEAIERARRRLLAGVAFSLGQPDNQAALEDLRTAAAVWRDEGQYLLAGFVMSEAVYAAWGNGDEVKRCVNQAIQDLDECIHAEPEDSLEALGALTKGLSELNFHFTGGTLELTKHVRAIQSELARRLLNVAAKSPNPCAYLAGSVSLISDFESGWQPLFAGEPLSVKKDAPPTTSISVLGPAQGVVGGHLYISLPSAFSLFLQIGDHKSAYQIVEQCPAAFQGIGVNAWTPALRGLLRLQEAEGAFEEAAALFAADKPPATPEELTARGGQWSGAHQMIWAKYFGALSKLERAKDNPGKAASLIADASVALEGTESGLVHPQVARLRVVVRALAGVLRVEPSLSLDEAQKEFRLQARMFGEEESDSIGLGFFGTAQSVLSAFEREPAKALAEGAIERLLTSVEELPMFGPEVARAVRPHVGTSALQAILGPHRSWIHRTLESVKDERVLTRLILRLLQAAIPKYAQIRHGPIEYGKDIVVVVEEDGRRILRMYQVKAGDITTPVWRNGKDELEEMYLVPVESLQLGAHVDAREGILVCNGHANPHVERTMGAWFEEERIAHARTFKFIHLDDLVNMIVQRRLITEFRAIAGEFGLLTEYGAQP